MRTRVRAGLDLDVRGACVRSKKPSQLTPCEFEAVWWILGRSNYFNESEVYSFYDGSWVSGPNLMDNVTYGSSGFCTTQLNKTHTMLIRSEYPNVVLYNWMMEEWTQEWTQMQSQRQFFSCISFGSGEIMVAGATDRDYAQNLTSIEIYDPEIDIWYYSKDLPSNPSNSSGRLSVWNDNPIFIDRENIWKFEDGKWTLLESKPTNELSSYNLGFTIVVPDDFIPDC